ncbi:hypothetical protein CISIN_1g0319001mg, partial [Citrus sinensis]
EAQLTEENLRLKQHFIWR